MATTQERFLLRRAWSNRLRSIQMYYDAVRQTGRVDGVIVSDLAARCRETDAELTEAMRPFTTEGCSE